MESFDFPQLPGHPIKLVKETWSRIGDLKKKFSVLFMTEIHSRNPEKMKHIFLGSKEESAKKMMVVMEDIIDHLESPEKLVPLLKSEAERKSERGAGEQVYCQIVDALLATLEKALGILLFDSKTHEAWKSVAGEICKVMYKSGADEKGKEEVTKEEEQAEALEKVAEVDGVSVTDAIREAIDTHIAERTADEEVQDRRQRRALRCGLGRRDVRPGGQDRLPERRAWHRIHGHV